MRSDDVIITWCNSHPYGRNSNLFRTSQCLKTVTWLHRKKLTGSVISVNNVDNSETMEMVKAYFTSRAETIRDENFLLGNISQISSARTNDKCEITFSKTSETVEYNQINLNKSMKWVRRKIYIHNWNSTCLRREVNISEIRWERCWLHLNNGMESCIYYSVMLSNLDIQPLVQIEVKLQRMIAGLYNQSRYWYLFSQTLYTFPIISNTPRL